MHVRQIITVSASRFVHALLTSCQLGDPPCATYRKSEVKSYFEWKWPLMELGGVLFLFTVVLRAGVLSAAMLTNVLQWCCSVCRTVVCGLTPQRRPANYAGLSCSVAATALGLFPPSSAGGLGCWSGESCERAFWLRRVHSLAGAAGTRAAFCGTQGTPPLRSQSLSFIALPFGFAPSRCQNRTAFQFSRGSTTRWPNIWRRFFARGEPGFLPPRSSMETCRRADRRNKNRAYRLPLAARMTR